MALGGHGPAAARLGLWQMLARLGAALLLGLCLPLLAQAAELAYPALSARIVDGAALLAPEARARIEA
ncbi:MAG: hypothetical protein ACK4VM_16145, partial [Bosea sp. (in: a-proteobacteria)]